MHFALTTEQELIVQTVRRFVEQEIYPHEEAVEKLRSRTNRMSQAQARRVHA